MFSQWRSKRHFPMDDTAQTVSSGGSRESSISTADAESVRSGVARSAAQTLPSRSAGVKTFGKNGFSAKTAKFRPGSSRDGSGSKSPMSFAAGPRTNSRGANSLEFGGGVVPDADGERRRAGFSEDTPSSPLQRERERFSPSDRKSPAPVVIGKGSPTVSRSPIGPPPKVPPKSHARIASIESVGGFEDFRSMLAFGTSDNLIDDSPTLTISTNVTTPEVLASFNATGATYFAQTPVVSKKAFGPAVPIRKPASSLALKGVDNSNSVSDATVSSPPDHNRHNSAQAVVIQRTEPSASPATSGAEHFDRSFSVASFPETVSAPSSSLLDSKEFSSPLQSESTHESVRSKHGTEESSHPEAAIFGLGILPEEESSTPSKAIANAVPGTSANSDPILQTTVMPSSSAPSSAHRSSGHTKSNSENSSHSSVDSWGRSSYLRELSAHFVDLDQGEGKNKDTHLTLSKSGRVQASDSGHSIHTAETSNDTHEYDQLSTIKERTESPESMLKHQVSSESNASRFLTRASSDARTSRTSASSAFSDEYERNSPLARMRKVHELPRGLEPHDLRTATSSSTILPGIHGIGSPTFGFRHRTSSQSSIARELLPPAELISAASSIKSLHARTSSAASVTSRKISFDANASQGRKDSGSIRRSSSIRQLTEIRTTPLPSAPFPLSTSMPLLASSNDAKPTASLPGTPNVAYGNALAKAVGKQRKGRPAALTLASTFNGPPGTPSASLMSPGGLALRGLPSPSKARAPPPQAPPPAEPLPPVPSTPSLVPKSPRVVQMKGAWPSLVPPPTDAVSPRVARASVDVGDSRDRPHPLMKPRVRTTSAPSVKSSPQSVQTFTEMVRESLAANESPDTSTVVGTPDAEETTKDVQDTTDREGARSTSTVVDEQPAAEPKSHARTASSTTISDKSERASVLSNSDSVEEVAQSNARIAVAKTLTRAPSTVLRMASLKESSSKRGGGTNKATAESEDHHQEQLQDTNPVPTVQKAADSVVVGVTPATPQEAVAPSADLREYKAGTETNEEVEVAANIVPSAPRKGSVSTAASGMASTATDKPVTDTSAPKSAGARTASAAPPSSWRSVRTATTTAGMHGRTESATSGISEAAEASTELGHGRGAGSRRGADSALSRRTSIGSLSNINDRRLEILQDKEVLSKPMDEATRLEILKRTEGRFAGAFGEVAQAFRQLQNEKMLLEQIVREKTPLNGVGPNNETLSEYLTSINSKMEQNAAEVKKLLDLLEQQREVMEQMLTTHRLEVESYRDDIDRLHHELDLAQQGIQDHRQAVFRLNGELERAHRDTVSARAETLKVRTILEDETSKKDKVLRLLRQAKDRLQDVELQHSHLQERKREQEEQHTMEVEQLRSASSMSSNFATAQDSEAASSWSPAGHSSTSAPESEVVTLRRLLEERDNEIAALRMGHADAVMDAADDTASVSDMHVPGGPPETVSVGAGEVEALRAQIQEQRAREARIRSAYKLLRDQLRRETDRRRSSVSSLTTPAAPNSHSRSSFHGGASTGIPSGLPTSADARGSGFSGFLVSNPFASQHHFNAVPGEERTPVKLKRLSLPIVAKASGLAGHVIPNSASGGQFALHVPSPVSASMATPANGGGVLPVSKSSSTTTTSSTPSTNSHPPSSFRRPSSQTSSASVATTSASSPSTPLNSASQHALSTRRSTSASASASSTRLSSASSPSKFRSPSQESCAA